MTTHKGPIIAYIVAGLLAFAPGLHAQSTESVAAAPSSDLRRDQVGGNFGLAASVMAKQEQGQPLTNATKWSSGHSTEPAAGNWAPILLSTADEIRVPPPAANIDAKTAEELEVVRKALRNPSPRQRALSCKWNTANQGKVWRGLADELILHSGMGAPSMLRAYAALHIAISDAVLAAWNNQNFYLRPRPSEMDASIQPLVPDPQNPAYPSDRAAAAGAAERILIYFFPRYEARISALADEAISAQVFGGLSLPSDVNAGKELGRQVAELVIAAIEADGRPNQLVFGRDIPWEQPFADETVRLGARFTRTIADYSNDTTWKAPQQKVGVVYGDALPWNQSLPIDPTAGNWEPLFLTRAKVNELAAVPPPPANNSPETKRDIEEIVTAVNNRTCYTDFIVFKWAVDQPGHWPVQILDTLAERYRWSAPRTERGTAILFTAMYDATLGTWYDKYHFMRPRPAHLEPTLPTVILTPKHPSYPAGHGTITAAAVAVLRTFFPQEEGEYGGMIEEVNNARVWAGVHYRGDMTAGNQVGDRVATAVLSVIHLDGTPGENPYHSVARNLSDNSGGPFYNPFYHRN
jgi:membrane-associated phospholipid phosphatase